MNPFLTEACQNPNGPHQQKSNIIDYFWLRSIVSIDVGHFYCRSLIVVWVETAAMFAAIYYACRQHLVNTWYESPKQDSAFIISRTYLVPCTNIDWWEHMLL